MKSFKSILIIFLAGYFVGDITGYSGKGLMPQVEASVDGMDEYSLRNDTDFRNAVKWVVTEYCHVHTGNSKSIPRGYSNWFHCDGFDGY